MHAVSIPTSFVRKLYLVNHQTIGNLHQFHSTGFSKFVTMQTLNEFKDAGYNDCISGEAFEEERHAQARLRENEYYVVVEVEAEAIAYRSKDGTVCLNRGHTPKIKALKTSGGDVFLYDNARGFQRERKPKTTVGLSAWALRSLERERN